MLNKATKTRNVKKDLALYKKAAQDFEFEIKARGLFVTDFPEDYIPYVDEALLQVIHNQKGVYISNGQFFSKAV